MKFLLVSAEKPTIKKEIEVPDEIVKQIKHTPKPQKKTVKNNVAPKQSKPRKRSASNQLSDISIKRVQHTKSII